MTLQREWLYSVKVDTNCYLSMNAFSPGLALTGRSYMLCWEPVSTEGDWGGRQRNREKVQNLWSNQKIGTMQSSAHSFKNTPWFYASFLFSSKISEFFLSKDRVGVRIKKYFEKGNGQGNRRQGGISWQETHTLGLSRLRSHLKLALQREPKAFRDWVKTSPWPSSSVAHLFLGFVQQVKCLDLVCLVI